MGRSDSNHVNSRLRAYVTGYAIAAACVLTFAVIDFALSFSAVGWQPFIFACLVVVAGLAALHVRIGSNRVAITWGQAVVFGGLVLVRPELLIICVALGSLRLNCSFGSTGSRSVSTSARRLSERRLQPE